MSRYIILIHILQIVQIIKEDKGVSFHGWFPDGLYKSHFYHTCHMYSSPSGSVMKSTFKEPYANQSITKSDITMPHVV